LGHSLHGRASDTKLGSDVAIKVLLAEMASDPERFRHLGHVAPGPQSLEMVLESGSGVRGPLAYNIQQQRTSPTPVEGDCGRIVGKPETGNAAWRTIPIALIGKP
jgi:hypothetical protein